MSRNELIEDMIKNLLDTGEERYLEIKLCLLAQTADSPKLRNFVCKLFAYTDTQRPPLLCMKGAANDLQGM